MDYRFMNIRQILRIGFMPVFVVVLASACATAPIGGGGQAPDNNENDNTDPQTSRITLPEVRFWAYQIQGIDNDGAVDLLVESSYDLLVIEPTSTDRKNAEFDSEAMVSRLHGSEASTEGKTKLVVAYIDIGEAEDWRYYWQEDWIAPTETETGTPDFLVRPDPDGWEGNYPVAFWDQRWKDIMIYNEDSMLQRAIEDGFDGIYMDWVEAYSDDVVAAAAQAEGLDPAQELVDFIAEIRSYARQQNPDFLIIPQNASELAEEVPDYLDIVDAIGQEQFFF